MKKKTRFFATALVTAMCATSVLGLVACSKDAGDITGDLGGDLPEDPGVYTIALNANGGSFGSGVKTSFTTTNGKITEALPTATQVTRENYTFAGWYTAQTGGSAVSITTYTATSDGTLYAHWDPVQQGDDNPGGGDNPGGDDNPGGGDNPGGDDNPGGGGGQDTPGGDQTDIVITFDPNGGTLVGEGSVTAVEGKIATPPTATWEGYEFLGWGEEQELASPIDFATKTFTESVTLYAQWDDNQHVSSQHYVTVGTRTFNLTEATPTDTATRSYTAEIQLAEGETIQFTIDGEVIEAWKGMIWKGMVDPGEKTSTFTVANAGTFNFAVNYYESDGTNDATWSIQADDGSTIDITGAEYANVDENEKSAWLVGKFAAQNCAEFEWGKGYKMTFDASANGGNGEYAISIHLEAGDVVKVRTVQENDKHGGYAFISNYGDSIAPGREHTEADDDDNIVIRDSGTYKFYFKANWNENGLWLEYVAD